MPNLIRAALDSVVARASILITDDSSPPDIMVVTLPLALVPLRTLIGAESFAVNTVALLPQLAYASGPTGHKF